MKLNDALDKLDHHFQMIALWESVLQHLQQSVDVPEKNIPVSPSIRSTMVSYESVRQGQEEVKKKIGYHKQMAEKFGESTLNPKTVPQEGAPAKPDKEKTDKKAKKKEGKAEPEKPAEPPATPAEPAKEATNG